MLLSNVACLTDLQLTTMMMKTVASLLLLLAIAGFGSSLVCPTKPVQQKDLKLNSVFETIEDSDPLDNPSIHVDKNIHPARKCGFCMGVSYKVHGWTTVFLTLLKVSRTNQLPCQRHLGTTHMTPMRWLQWRLAVIRVPFFSYYQVDDTQDFKWNKKRRMTVSSSNNGWRALILLSIV